jgi:hypothetical protein
VNTRQCRSSADTLRVCVRGWQQPPVPPVGLPQAHPRRQPDLQQLRQVRPCPHTHTRTKNAHTHAHLARSQPIVCMNRREARRCANAGSLRWRSFSDAPRSDCAKLRDGARQAREMLRAPSQAHRHKSTPPCTAAVVTAAPLDFTPHHPAPRHTTTTHHTNAPHKT